MEYDIINITGTELAALTVVQTRLLRTAQQKKNELYRKVEKELAAFRAFVLTSGMKNSSLIEDKRRELEAEAKYQTDILADNLIYNMSLNEPGGDSGEEGGDESAGYIVDYTLSYNERYVIVRDFYLAIADPDERMALYAADETAKKYLASYYSTLYNVLATYSK